MRGVRGGLLDTAHVINRAQPEWTPPQRGPASKEITAAVAALIAVAVVGALHGWLGPWPFPG